MNSPLRLLLLFYKIKSDEVLDKSSTYYLNTSLDIGDNIKTNARLENNEFIDDYTYSGMIRYGIAQDSSKLWPEKLNGSININSIDIYSKGEGKKVTPVNSSPLAVNLDSKNVKTKEVSINKTISYYGAVSEITKLIKSPTSVTMEKINKSVSSDNNGVYLLTYLWIARRDF